MKKIFLVLSVLFLFGCGYETNIEKKSTNTIYSEYGSYIQEFKYEGCEYIGYLYGGNGDWGTHKGNCSNPIHDYNK